MNTPKTKPKTPKNRVGSREFVRLRLSLTAAEAETLKRIMGMTANDDGDEDAPTLQSIQRKVLAALPNH